MPQHAPVVIRHGHVVLIPSILEQLVPVSSAVDIAALASVAKDVIDIASQHTPIKIRKLKDVLYAFRGLTSETRRLLEDINVAYALLRHVPLSELQGLPASLALLFQEGGCSIGRADCGVGNEGAASARGAGPLGDDHGEPGPHCAEKQFDLEALLDDRQLRRRPTLLSGNPNVVKPLVVAALALHGRAAEMHILQRHMDCSHETVHEQGAALRR